MTLEQALQLMSLPRVVGTDVDDVEITAQNGRYGPYLKKGTDSRSLESEDQIFSITLEEARAIYAQPKQRGRAAAKPPLKDLGTDPVSGRPMIIKEGRFGAYVTDGEINATLRRGDDIEDDHLRARRGAAGRETRQRTNPKEASGQGEASRGCSGHLDSETGREESGGEEGTRQNGLTVAGRERRLSRPDEWRS